MVQLPGVNTPQFDWIPRAHRAASPKPVGPSTSPRSRPRRSGRPPIRAARNGSWARLPTRPSSATSSVPASLDRLPGPTAVEGQQDAETVRAGPQGQSVRAGARRPRRARPLRRRSARRARPCSGLSEHRALLGAAERALAAGIAAARAGEAERRQGPSALIRIVALAQGAVAGAAGALAWELVLRSAILPGLPTFDIVREPWDAGLFPAGRPGPGGRPAWSPMPSSASAGRSSTPISSGRSSPGGRRCRGSSSASVPAALALFVVVTAARADASSAPHQVQLTVRHAAARSYRGEIARSAAGPSRSSAWSLARSTRDPVGYPVGPAAGRPARRRARRRRNGRAPERPTFGFIFATGIECSYPTIENGRWRRDQMHATGHYRVLAARLRALRARSASAICATARRCT